MGDTLVYTGPTKKMECPHQCPCRGTTSGEDGVKVMGSWLARERFCIDSRGQGQWGEDPAVPTPAPSILLLLSLLFFFFFPLQLYSF